MLPNCYRAGDGRIRKGGYSWLAFRKWLSVEGGPSAPAGASVVAQRHHRIDARGAARGQEARQRRNDDHHANGRGNRPRIGRRKAIQQRRDEAARPERDGDADDRRRWRPASSTRASRAAARPDAARRGPCGCRSRSSVARRCRTSGRTGRWRRAASRGRRTARTPGRRASPAANRRSTCSSCVETSISGRFGSICLTASRTAPVTLVGIAGSPHLDHRTDRTVLQIRHVHRRRRGVADAVVFGVAKDADDLELPAGLDARPEALADRVLVGKDTSLRPPR